MKSNLPNAPSIARPGMLPLALLAALIAGCGGPADTDESDRPNLLEPQSEALEKARAVEDDVLEAARRQREQIDEQG